MNLMLSKRIILLLFLVVSVFVVGCAETSTMGPTGNAVNVPNQGTSARTECVKNCLDTCDTDADCIEDCLNKQCGLETREGLRMITSKGLAR